MYPVLFSVGSVAISSFGLFLSAGLILAIFFIWRLVRVYDLDQEKTLDLILITFTGSVIGARVAFAIVNYKLFDSFERVLLINNYPGLSFWGGLITGLILIRLLSPAFKLNFWRMADFGAIGLSVGLVLGNIGCFLGGCRFGFVSSLPVAIPVVGQIGRRLPLSIIESIFLVFIFWYLWKQVVRFHFIGKITALFLIYYGVVRLVLEFYLSDRKVILNQNIITPGVMVSLVMIILGVYVYYRRSKRKFLADIKSVLAVVYSNRKRKELVYILEKVWYNHYVKSKIFLSKGVETLVSAPRFIKRKLNVKFAPKNYR